MTYRMVGDGVILDPVGHFAVPIGDPIGICGEIHRVVCHAQGSAELSEDEWVNEFQAITACGLETSVLRAAYPTEGKACEKCWPVGICNPIRGPRPFLDNTEYNERVPF